MEQPPIIPQLTAEEVRVLGAMVEKSQATPEYYPITLNSLVAACNQKSSRDPVVAYSEDTVDYVLEKLRDKGLAAQVSGTGRVVRHTHRVGNTGLGLTPAQAAVLSVVMLRGAQTVSEIKTRGERQFRFPSLEFTQEVVASLMTPERPFIEEAPRRPGQKESRFRHRFFPYKDEPFTAPEPLAAPSILDETSSLKDSIAALQNQLDELQSRVDRIEQFLTDLGLN